MVSPKAKGNRTQLKAIKELEISGWLVSKAGQQVGKFTKEKDLFGLFDLAAIKPGEMRLVQVTTNRPHTHQPYQDFSRDYHNNNITIWQHVWYDRKGWRKFQYKLGGKLETDER